MKVIAGLLVAVVLAGAVALRPAQAQTYTCASIREMSLAKDERGLIFRSLVCDDINRVVIMTMTPVAWSLKNSEPATFQGFVFQAQRLFGLIGYTVEFGNERSDTNSTPGPAAFSGSPSVASASSASGVLLDVHGTGMKQTKSFTVTGEVTLQYAYTCNGVGNFSIMRYSEGGSFPVAVDVNELKSQNSDSTELHARGTFYLQISGGICDWHVTVRQ
jgi:hypothetical protein